MVLLENQGITFTKQKSENNDMNKQCKNLKEGKVGLKVSCKYL